MLSSFLLVVWLRLEYVVDLHEDIGYYYATGGHDGFPVEDFSIDFPNRHGDIPKYFKAGVRLVFASIFPLMPSFNPNLSKLVWGGYEMKPLPFVNSPRAVGENVMEQIKIYHRLIAFHPELEPVSEKGDVDRLSSGGKIGFLIALEGAEALDEPGDLELFYRLGVRSLQLTWNYDVKYGSSCMSVKDYGLTGFGEALVEEANRLGVILDISHAGEKTSLELIEASKLPVIASHANVKAVKNHVRNLSDRVLEALYAKNGLIGFTLIPSTISDNPTIKDLVKHVRYVYENYGSKILALGTDYFGLIAAKPPKGLEDISKLNNLWNALAEAGLSDEALKDMAYRNALRVVKTHEENWRRLKP
jgi:membrane dipeptidase